MWSVKRTPRNRAAWAGLISVALLFGLTLASPPADAYKPNPAGCRWSGSNPAIGYRFDNVTILYRAATTVAADTKWDSTSAPGYFYNTTSTSDDDVVVFDDDYDANGKLAWVSGNCGSDDIWNDPLYLWWNTYYMDSKTSIQKYVVGVHEFGHVYGLAHFEDDSCKVNKEGLMHENPLGRYSTCGWTNPTNDDVAGVESIY